MEDKGSTLAIACLLMYNAVYTLHIKGMQN